jgi:hypothetical protein
MNVVAIAAKLMLLVGLLDGFQIGFSSLLGFK